MPDNPSQREPSEEERPATPPPPPQPDQEATAVLPETGDAGPRPEGRVRQFVGHRATQIVAAGIAGLLIGGGAVALLDRDHRDRHFPRGAYSYGQFDRGEGPPRLHPRFLEERGELREKIRDKLERKIPQHHHGEDGEVIPGPAPTE